MDPDERTACPGWFPLFLLSIGLVTLAARQALM